MNATKHKDTLRYGLRRLATIIVAFMLVSPIPVLASPDNGEVKSVSIPPAKQHYGIGGTWGVRHIPSPMVSTSGDEGDNSTNAPAPIYCTNPVGQLITDTIASDVLGLELPVQVYLPPCYDGTRFEYPTLYLLQGSGYEVGEWVDDGLMRIADLHMSLDILSPFIIVMPANDLSSGDSSRYLGSSGGKGSWEDFIVNELVPTIDQKYSTWKDREGRAIGGISRGGYWSLEIALTNPDTFASVGGHSPAIAASYLYGVSDDFSILSYAKSIDTVRMLRIYLDAGDNDETLPGMQQLAGQLDAQHVKYTSSVGEGVHDDVYWTDRMADYLAFYASNWPATVRIRSSNAGTHSDSVRSSQ